MCGTDTELTYEWKRNKLYEGDDVMDESIYNCLVKSTHNSYLQDLQIFGKSTLDSIVYQLNEGVRSIELDIFKHVDKDVLIVTHGDVRKHLQGTSYIYLHDVLQLIQIFAWRDTTLPLFMFIELQIESEEIDMYIKIDELIRFYFSARLFVKKEENNKFTIRDLKGKLLIWCTNSYKNKPEMNEYLNPFEIRNIPATHEFSDEDDYTEWNKEHFTRVYPKNKIRSTNYDIHPFIQKGCQFITINYQTKDNYYYDYQDIFPDNYGIISYEQALLSDDLTHEGSVVTDIHTVDLENI